MKINYDKLVREWSERMNDRAPIYTNRYHRTVLREVMKDFGYPLELVDGVQLLNEAGFTYSILSTKKKYQPQWLDYINNNKEFELEPYPNKKKPKFVKPKGGATTAKIKTSILKSIGKGSQFTFEDLLNNKGTKKDWDDWFGSNTDPTIPTNKGIFPLGQISKSTFTGQKSKSGGATKPRDAAFYEQGICMAHAIINHNKSRKDAYTLTDIDETKYLKYKAEVEDTVGNNLVKNSKVSSLPILQHTGKGGLGGVQGKNYKNATPKTDIKGAKRYSLKKSGEIKESKRK